MSSKVVRAGGLEGDADGSGGSFTWTSDNIGLSEIVSVCPSRLRGDSAHQQGVTTTGRHNNRAPQQQGATTTDLEQLDRAPKGRGSVGSLVGSACAILSQKKEEMR